MLRPEDINNEQFELSVLGGYKREHVDSFFSTVASDYEKLYKENNELISKLRICVEKIDEYQKDEQFLKAAILNAEKLNESSVRELEKREREIETAAREKADELVSKAKAEADEIVGSAKREADKLLTSAKIDSEDMIKKARIDAAEAIRTCEIETAAKISELKAAQTIEENNLNNLKREVSEFKENVLKIYKQHLNSLSKLPSYEAKAKEPDEPVVDPEPTITEPPVKPTIEEPEIPEEKVNATPEESLNAKTAEFVIEKTPSAPKLDEKEVDRAFKFRDLKFGTDFDVKKDGE